MANLNLSIFNSNDSELWDCERLRSISSEELRKNINVGSPQLKATVAVPVVLLVIIVVLFIDEVTFLIRNRKKWRRTTLTLWVVSIYPVLGSLSVLGLFMPRTSPVISFAINFYFSLTLKKFFDLVLNYYGGKKEMVEALKDELVVPANPFPCCFVCCWRNKPMTISRINALKVCVYQVVFVYPVAYFIQNMITTEYLVLANLVGQIFFLINEIFVAVSGFVCLYGFTVIGRSSREALRHFFIIGKFYSVSLVVPCASMQNLILDILERFDVLPCGFPYPDRNQAFLLQSYIFLLELFFLSILGWYSYKRHEDNGDVTLTKSRKSEFVKTNLQIPSVCADDQCLPKQTDENKNTMTSNGEIEDCFKDDIV